jgi:hypothetical protein
LNIRHTLDRQGIDVLVQKTCDHCPQFNMITKSKRLNPAKHAVKPQARAAGVLMRLPAASTSLRRFPRMTHNASLPISARAKS